MSRAHTHVCPARLYAGERTPEGCRVVVLARNGSRSRSFPLRLRLDLWNHSPTGFEWGYGGSGPAQLALAILADLYPDETAVRLHQAFKWAVVARIAGDFWHLTDADVRAAVDAL